MKKYILTIVVSVLSIITFGQAIDKKSEKSISLGLTFSPDYCYRILKYDQSDEDFANYRNEIEIPKFGFTTGLSVLLQLNRSIALESGLIISDKGQQTKNIEIGQEDPDQTIPDEIHNSWHYYYVGVPIKLNYYFKKGDLKLFVSPGFSANIFIKRIRIKSEFNPDNQHTYYMTEGFNKLNIEAILGAGLDYTISGKIILRFEPIFRYSLTPLDDFKIKRYLYSIGANFGLYFKLKK